MNLRDNESKRKSLGQHISFTQHIITGIMFCINNILKNLLCHLMGICGNATQNSCDRSA